MAHDAYLAMPFPRDDAYHDVMMRIMTSNDVDVPHASCTSRASRRVCLPQPGMLVSIAGMGVSMVIFIVVMDRVSDLWLALLAGSVYVFGAALVYITIHVSYLPHMIRALAPAT